MGPRWALHLSCTIASMVVKRNKSSICPPACIHGCTAKTLQAPLASSVLFCHQAGKTMPNILAFWICQFLTPLLYVLYSRLACAKVVPIFSQDILWELVVIPTILSAVLVKRWNLTLPDSHRQWSEQFLWHVTLSKKEFGRHT